MIIARIERSTIMKKSYKKLYVLEFIIFISLILNSFVFDFLTGYGMPIYLLIILVVFKLLFGFERDKHRYTKDILLDITIFLLVFFIIYYLIGIPIGFARTAKYLNWYGITKFIIPLILSICLQEYLRYAILTKSEGSKGLLVTTCILFILINITNTLGTRVFEGQFNFFIFFALSFMPAITNNILCTYLCLNGGYKPNMLYNLVINLYLYILPIVPNPNEYIKSLIKFLLPIFLIYRIYSLLSQTKDEEIKRDYKKKSLTFVVPVIITIILVYFVSGYFKYYAIAVASGSMKPDINVGDVVIINQKIDKNEIEPGTVVAYKYNGNIIVHRVFNVINYQNKRTFYTKGDTNTDADPWAIKEDDILGEVKLKINWIGLPTIWINEILEK